MNTLQVLHDDFSHWNCSQCNEPLKFTAVELVYLESKFSVELPACPACGYVLIPESLALGKMADVEQLLEDK
ncbi:DVU_1557 family redox protein [Halodesulfovibrio spirochaetisodalis]|uniref:DNA-binding protein n=1 Tax=Halodesulfovibrio spirochaetisodalis TaxID=1560234 RepID=A0A1B7XMV2_9BACT|nr:CLJU_RS11820 family redox protein [Halodesulfovibrio spirochaetisodalis]OBQ56843.1 DNA-binding protein [Halodesulfovibrio spirochaetisodalis]